MTDQTPNPDALEAAWAFRNSGYDEEITLDHPEAEQEFVDDLAIAFEAYASRVLASDRSEDEDTIIEQNMEIDDLRVKLETVTSELDVADKKLEPLRNISQILLESLVPEEEQHMLLRFLDELDALRAQLAGVGCPECRSERNHSDFLPSS